MKKYPRMLWLAVAAVCVAGFASWMASRDEARPADPATRHPVEHKESATATSPLKAPPVLKRELASSDVVPPAAGVEIHGFVLDASGLPNGRASVRSHVGGETLASTNESGEFELTLRGAAITVVGTDGTLWSPPVIISPADSRHSVMLRLQPPTELTVTVVAATTRRPIPRAEVALNRADGSLENGTTGDSGVVTLSVSSGASSVSAIAPGYSRVSRRVLTSASSGGVHAVVMALPPGVTLDGVVTGERGGQVSGAVVTALDVSNIPIAHATSDTHGRFSFDELYPGTFRLQALAEGVGAGATGAIELKPPGRTVNVTLSRGETVSGVVLGLDDRPAEGVTVRLSAPFLGGFATQKARSVTSNADGRFEFVNVAPSEVIVWGTLGTLASETVSVQKGQKALTLHLGERLSIRGYVTDQNGNRLPDAVVSAKRPSAAAPSPTVDATGASATTGADGAFSLLSLEEGEWEVSAVAADNLHSSLGHTERSRTRATAGASDVVLEVPGTGSIEGWVEVDDGSIPENVTVLVSGLRLAHPAAGSFLLQGIPEGEHELILTGPDFQAQKVSSVRVRAAEATNLEGIVVRRGRTLSGMVRGVDGKPVSGATVVASRVLSIKPNSISFRRIEEEPDIRVTHSEESGRYRLAGLADGTMSVIAEHPDRGRSAPRAIPATETSVDFTLAPTQKIAGTVSRGGDPIGGCAIVAEPTGGTARFTAVTSPTGQYVVAGLPPNEYTVTALAQNQGNRSVMQRRQVTVAKGAPLHLDIEFPATVGGSN